MPAHKRSWSDSLNGEEPRDQQFSHQDAKQSRTEREPKTEIEAEEEEQQKQQKEGDPDDEGREEDEGDEEKQHKQLEEATGARGYVFSFFLLLGFCLLGYYGSNSVLLLLLLAWFTIC